MLYREIPFLRFTLPLATGIILRSVVGYLPSWLLLVYGVIFILVVFLAASDRRQNLWYGLAILNLFIIAGFIICNGNYTRIGNSRIEPSKYTVRVDKFPAAREKSVKVPSTIMIKMRNNRYRPGDKIMLYFPPSGKVTERVPGDLLNIRLDPQIISDFNPEDNFDYSRYMLYQGYKYYSFVREYSETGIRSPGILHRSLLIQKQLLEKYASGITDTRSLSIVSALTLGYRDMMDEEVRTRFNDAGISHIMAVSGLHVGIISSIALGLMQLLRIRSGLLRLILAIITIWSFALITGLSPSVTRASLMFTFIYTGKYTGRNVNPVNSLLASAFLLLIINPFIIYSVGFQLSYSAVLFILLFFKKLDNLIPLSGLVLRKTWSIISVTLLAQAGTLPFILYHFRRVPLLSVITNIFAIPLAFLILLTGFTFLAMPSSFFLSNLLARIIEIETGLLYSISDWIASLLVI